MPLIIRISVEKLSQHDPPKSNKEKIQI